VAHNVAVAAASLLADQILSGQQTASVAVNSSHHQSAEIIGDGLRAVARCPEDGVIEAIEGTVPGHYVLAVQWHPERTFGQDPVSRRLFQAFVDSARQWSDRKA
ncbi:MAG: gamma-glutamyl-gamma-aminobutyrate hydrolase family protein, partial [Terriglobales bacterium]